jgi:hypothetical protein
MTVSRMLLKLLKYMENVLISLLRHLRTRVRKEDCKLKNVKTTENKGCKTSSKEGYESHYVFPAKYQVVSYYQG